MDYDVIDIIEHVPLQIVQAVLEQCMKITLMQFEEGLMLILASCDNQAMFTWTSCEWWPEVRQESRWPQVWLRCIHFEVEIATKMAVWKLWGALDFPGLRPPRSCLISDVTSSGARVDVAVTRFTSSSHLAADSCTSWELTNRQLWLIDLLGHVWWPFQHHLDYIHNYSTPLTTCCLDLDGYWAKPVW